MFFTSDLNLTANNMEIFFTDQPKPDAAKDAFIKEFLTNWGAINKWLQTTPERDDVIRAILSERKNQKRPVILDRLLAHFYKREKALTLAKLTA